MDISLRHSGSFNRNIRLGASICLVLLSVSCGSVAKPVGNAAPKSGVPTSMVTSSPSTVAEVSTTIPASSDVPVASTALTSLPATMTEDVTVYDLRQSDTWQSSCGLQISQIDCTNSNLPIAPLYNADCSLSRLFPSRCLEQRRPVPLGEGQSISFVLPGELLNYDVLKASALDMTSRCAYLIGYSYDPNNNSSNVTVLGGGSCGLPVTEQSPPDSSATFPSSERLFQFETSTNYISVGFGPTGSILGETGATCGTTCITN
jgi:hypothetical protein